jgi:hypothetical protein
MDRRTFRIDVIQFGTETRAGSAGWITVIVAESA